MALSVGRGIALLFHDRGTRGGDWSAARPGRTLSPGKTRYQLYRRLNGLQGRSGWAENLVPTGIRSRIVQPECDMQGGVHRGSWYVANYEAILTLNPLTWKIWRAPSNASRWQMRFNSEFKGLKTSLMMRSCTLVMYPAPRVGI